jgi:multicomponent Na+:H+ antiporter subunit G
MSDVVGYILIAVGILFNIFGCVGLVRFPDVYNRLQAATKCVTLGTVLLLVGVALANGTGALAAKAIICAVFVLATSPTAAHAIARGAYASGVALWEGTVVDKYAERVKDSKREPSRSGALEQVQLQERET